MHINYNCKNKQDIINQLATQTRFNMARLDNLEKIVNIMLESEKKVNLDRALNKAFNAHNMFYSSDIVDFTSNSLFNNVQNTNYMFDHCQKLTNINLYSATFYKLISAINMFNNCPALTDIKIYSDFYNLIYATGMFSNCTALTNIDLSFSTFDNLQIAESMFNACSNTININLSKAKFDKVTNTINMFYNCSDLETLDLSSATFESLDFKDNNDNVENMFTGIKQNCIVYIPETTYNRLKATNGPFNSGWTKYKTDEKGRGFTQKQ